MKTIDITKDNMRIGWAGTWLVDMLDSHSLVAMPRLRLDQETTLALTQRIPYARVFAGATLPLRGEPRPFVVIAATFDLYRTSEPDISDFAVLLPDRSKPLPPPGLVISKAAAMLRGSR